MAIIDIQLDAQLTKAQAQRELLKPGTLDGLLVSFEYDRTSGIATVNTRAFPPFPEVLPESPESALINSTMESFAAIQTRIDKREADLVRAENQLALDRAQLERERAEFEAQKEGTDTRTLLQRIMNT